MKIGYFADGPWAHKALDRILDDSRLEVVFIVARYDTADPVLRRYAEAIGIPFYLHPDVNSLDFIQSIERHQPDLLVSMSFNQILKKQIITAAPLGFINCHAGALPFYRGRNILNWALINGEEQFGVTVHYVDEGIDTGDIILQRFAPITSNDDYGTLLTKAIDLCAELLPEALVLIAEGKASRIRQDSIHPVGFYCSQRRDGDEWIDWSLPSMRIHNLIRGISRPGPGARSIWNGTTVAILKSALIDAAPNYIDRPGTIVGRDENGVTVKTGDSTIRLLQVANVAKDGSLEKIRIPRFRFGCSFDAFGGSPFTLIRRVRP